MKFEHLYFLLYEQLLLCGGAAGHLLHPFEDTTLSFKDLKEIIQKSLNNMEFEEIGEKLDGINIMFTYKDNEIKFARNNKQLKNPLSESEFQEFISSKEKTPQRIIDIFNEVSSTILKSSKNIEKSLLEKTFNNGQSFMNVEIINPNGQNVINYKDNYVLRFQTLNTYDKNFNLSNVKPISNNDQIITKFKLSDNKYKIIGKDNIQIKIDPKLKSKTTQYLSELDDIMKEKGLNETSKLKEIYGGVNPESLETTERKKLIYPIEIIFLKLGNDILKNCQGSLSSNKDLIKKNLDEDIAKIEKNGNEKDKEKLNYELKRFADLDKQINEIEGIVFKYKNKEYKYTGSFAPINTIKGIAKKII